MEAFPQHLPAGTAKATITLRYPCKALDGTVYWAGLHVAGKSDEMWRHLVTRNCEILEIGVQLEEKKPASNIPVDEVLFAENGKSLQMYFDVLEGLKWIVERTEGAAFGSAVSWEGAAA